MTVHGPQVRCSQQKSYALDGRGTSGDKLKSVLGEHELSGSPLCGGFVLFLQGLQVV